MWVVKLGGSLNRNPLLTQWLDLLVQLGGGRVAVVCGGGHFADEVRRAQVHWSFTDLAAHNMAVLAMAQSSCMALGLNPKLRLARSGGDIRRVLHGGHTALWLPLECLRDAPDADTHWGYTSDSIALDLARQLSAERMIVVKSCAIDPGAELAALSAAGILDDGFSRRAADTGFPIDVIHHSELERMRALLLGQATAPGV
jgi:5-(aminomethyl)-3-furanmethanol phosphate kinase